MILISVSGGFDSVYCFPAFLERLEFLASSKLTGLGDVFLPLFFYLFNCW